MKVTTPRDMSVNDDDLFNDAISKFESMLSNCNKGDNHYDLTIYKCIPLSVCIKIQNLYLSVGWKRVTCESSLDEFPYPYEYTILKLWRNE